MAFKNTIKRNIAFLVPEFHWQYFLVKSWICAFIILGGRNSCILSLSIKVLVIIKSTQYKKLCGSHIKIWNLANQHGKNETKNIRILVFSFSTINLVFWCFLICFFMWFARLQILIFFKVHPLTFIHL